jgi:hypothetical protein
VIAEKARLLLTPWKHTPLPSLLSDRPQGVPLQLPFRVRRPGLLTCLMAGWMMHATSCLIDCLTDCLPLHD